MSEKNLPEQLKQDATGKQITAAPQSARRKLLKSTVAIPIIMTLHSGAALARSSNMLTPVEEGEAVTVSTGNPPQSQYVCVDIVDTNGPPYDVGDVPTATLVQNADDCTPTGQSPGLLVSSAAYTSLLGKGMTLPDL